MEESSTTSNNTVLFKCVKEGRKLRVRVISPGYNSEANCQFPRAIRQEGRTFSAPRRALKFARGPAGKFFYRVDGKSVTVLSPEDVEVNIEKIFEVQEECVICLCVEHEVVVVPCGHYCMCKDCGDRLRDKKCPMCRGRIDQLVTRDQIQV